MKNEKKISFKKQLFILILVNLFLSLIISEIYLLLKNTLKNNGNWVSSKTLVESHVMGSGEFFERTQALAQCHLNLGAWYGFQEVIYRNKVNPQEIEFRFFLTRDSYFYFIFNKDEDKFSGLRISTNRLYENVYFTANNDGEFINKSKFAVSNLEIGKWSHAKIKLQKDNLLLFINNKLIGVFKEDLLGEQSFGFRGGARNVFIDDLLIRQKDSQKLIRESFCNNKSFPYLFFIILIMLTTINLSIFFLLKEISQETLFYLISINIFALLMSSFFVFFINYYFMGRYPKDTWRGAPELAKITNINVMTKYSIKGNENIYRILYMGTSQAAGSGAKTEKETFVKLVENKLNKEVNGFAKIEFINTGVRGSDSSMLLDYYRKSWIKLSPRITVVHLSNNDNDPDLFYSNLREIVNLDRQNGIKTVFVLEANSIESTSGELPLHEVMRKVGRENNILTIDLHQYLKQKYDTGILWWDFFHLTPFGHKLTADFLFGYISNLINS